MSWQHSIPEAARALADWFDPRGRMSRRAYVPLLLRVMLIATALFCLTIWIAGMGFREAAFAVVVLGLVLWLVILARTVRRLHDRDRTGWWLALTILLYAGSFFPIDNAADAYPLPVALYALLTVVFFVWFIVETIGLRGTPGENRYGDETPMTMPLPVPEPDEEPIDRQPP